MVYALLFAFMYESAQSKWMETSQLCHQEITHLQHILIMSIMFERTCYDEGLLPKLTVEENKDRFDAEMSTQETEEQHLAHLLRKCSTISVK